MDNQSPVPKPRKLLDQVGDAIQALHYSSRTGETYLPPKKPASTK